MNGYEVFDLGDIVLQHGTTLRDAKLAYKTYGTLNEEESNAIVYPTWYSGRHWENEWLIGGDTALDHRLDGLVPAVMSGVWFFG